MVVNTEDLFSKSCVDAKLYFFLVSLNVTSLRKINREHTREETKVKNDSANSVTVMSVLTRLRHSDTHLQKCMNACTHTH